MQPKPELADWTTLEVPYVAAEIPPELVDQEIEVLRESVADLAPVEGRAAQTGDVVVVDAVEEGGEAQRDLVLELGAGRLLEDVERALIGASPGDTRAVEYSLPDDSSRTTQVTVKEIKEKVLPPADDDFARAASEFDTYAELRNEIESRLREQLEDELDAAFRAETIDRLVVASKATASGPLVEARSRELLNQLGRSLDRRGISADLYLQLTGQTPEQLAAGVRADAAQSVARELVLEARGRRRRRRRRRLPAPRSRPLRDAASRPPSEGDPRPDRLRGEADLARPRPGARQALDSRQGNRLNRNETLDPR